MNHLLPATIMLVSFFRIPQAAAGVPEPIDVAVPVSGGTERIYLQVPDGQPADRPLLLIFHGAYYDEHWNNPNDPLQAELRQLFEEAAERGWYSASVNGGEARLVGTYAGPELHRRTTEVIRHMRERYQVDLERIYTLGYSMGGIDAVNYAARHVNPEEPMVAAVWCWSGALCAEVSDVSCGLVPCEPLARIAASAVQVVSDKGERPTGQFVTHESLAWNLEHIFLTTTEATRDIDHVTGPSLALQALTAQWKEPDRHTHLADHGKTHNDVSGWDPVRICDFFEGRSVELPTEATRTVIVEDTRYFWFHVTRHDQKRTGSFGWRFDGQELSLSSVRNLASLEFDVDAGVDSPLNGSENLRIHLATAERQRSDIVLNHLSGGRPVSVTRNGESHSDETAGVWSWDERSSRLTLFGSANVGSVDWEIAVR